MAEAWRHIGRLLIIIGGILIGVGLIMYWIGSRGWSWPRLPGDIVIERPGYSIYLPLGTSLLVSLLLSLLLWLFRRLGDGSSL